MGLYASAVYAIVVCPSEWCGCSVLAAEWLDSSGVGIAQLTHAVGESILCCEGWRCGSSQMTLGRTCYFTFSSFFLNPLAFLMCNTHFCNMPSTAKCLTNNNSALINIRCSYLLSADNEKEQHWSSPSIITSGFTLPVQITSFHNKNDIHKHLLSTVPNNIQNKKLASRC